MRPGLKPLLETTYDASDIKDESKQKADSVAALISRMSTFSDALQYLRNYKAEHGAIPSEHGPEFGTDQYYAWALGRLSQYYFEEIEMPAGWTKQLVRDAICATFGEGAAVGNSRVASDLGVKTYLERADGAQKSAKPEKTREIKEHLDQVRRTHTGKSKSFHHSIVAKRMNMTVGAIKKQVQRHGL